MPDPKDWFVEVHVDRDWYEQQDSPVPMPDLSDVMTIDLTHEVVLVGRTSRARRSTPLIDLAHDTGVSRRQAELLWRPDGWYVRDLGSANGTHLAQPDGRCIELRHEALLGDGDQLFMGSWTRLVLRRRDS